MKELYSRTSNFKHRNFKKVKQTFSVKEPDTVTQAYDQARLHETVSKSLKSSKRQAGSTPEVYRDANLVF